jgi:hypothetical protein
MGPKLRVQGGMGGDLRSIVILRVIVFNAVWAWPITKLRIKPVVACNLFVAQIAGTGLGNV